MEVAANTLFQKAGCVIFGENAQGERTLLVPYNEGRFGKEHDKYYVLPKGSVENGDSIFTNAVRETHEETGIDVAKLLGSEAIAKIEKGEEVRNLKSEGYPGVKILRASAKPHIHTYMSPTGKLDRMALFSIEVSGIENLKSGLKNKENANTPDAMGRAPLSTRQRLQQLNPPLPPFGDLVEWLRTGTMPVNRPWNKGKQAPEPLFALGAGEASLLATLESKYNPPGRISTPEHLRDLCVALTREDIPTYVKLREYFEKIKTQLNELDITKGYTHEMVLDTRAYPLQFFQEGGEIITARDYFRICLDRMDENIDYLLGFGGHGSADPNQGRGLRLRQAEFMGVLPFMKPEDLFLGVMDHMMHSKVTPKKQIAGISHQGITTGVGKALSA